MALLTGARGCEVVAARWTMVDWDRRFIRLPDSKNNKPRTIHLSDAALEVLRTVPHVGSYVIAGGKTGQPFKTLSRCWIEARKYAGLEDVRFHDLRHSYASLAAGRGVPLLVIGKLLGHQDAKTTQRYAHLCADAVAVVANDGLGAAMTAAIAKGKPQPATVIKLRAR